MDDKDPAESLIKPVASMKTSNNDSSWATCPLTGAPFVEPVIDHEGNTYEKEAILEWLLRNSTSPITSSPLSPNQLFPNRALQDLMVDGDEISTVPSTVASDDDQDTDKTELSELAGQAVVKTSFSKLDDVGIVRVQVPDDDSKRHMPASIICVIDESYSMDGAATTQEDQEGNSGLSLLDIVKHATKTVIESLGPEDKLAIVTYADSADTRFPFMKMTRDNKTKATKVVECFNTRGSTNLWGGLVQAMELASKETLATDVFLLTDGLPNIHPPRGELETLQRYKEKQTPWNCRVSTFGFGYSLDSTLLNEIAIKGDGQYFFIPDSSFVGTVFINAASFVLSTALDASTVSFEFDGAGMIQGYGSQSETEGRSFPLASLSYGQTFDFLIHHDIGNERCSIASSLYPNDIKTVRLRTRLVALIRFAEKRFSDNIPEALALAQEDVRNLIDEFNVVIDCCGSNDSEGRSILEAMKEDLTGQITEAYSHDNWHSKWGKHYLLSLARAHELQRCTNFKDPGLQVYATRKFSLIRDMAEDVFCKIPPPKPSRRINKRNYRPVASMSSYYNAAAGCLAKGEVRMADGRYVDVSLVAPGDVLQVHSGLVSVRCVVTTQCEKGVQDLVELEGGVLVTPWHPVREKGTNEWVFPATLAPIKRYYCDIVYNFVLEEGISVPIGPFEAITLAHGVVDDPVAKHEYFGSNTVIRDLSQMIGWNQGRVHLGIKPGKRDPESGLITSFVQNIETLCSDDSGVDTTIDVMSSRAKAVSA